MGTPPVSVAPRWRYQMVSLRLPIVLSVAALGVMGCTEAPSSESSEPGSPELRVKETSTRLEITGVDAQGAIVGHLELSLGLFFSEENQRLAAGRMMTVKVGDKQIGHESEGFDTLALPLMHRDEHMDLRTFL